MKKKLLAGLASWALLAWAPQALFAEEGGAAKALSRRSSSRRPSAKSPFKTCPSQSAPSLARIWSKGAFRICTACRRCPPPLRCTARTAPPTAAPCEFAGWAPPATIPAWRRPWAPSSTASTAPEPAWPSATWWIWIGWRSCAAPKAPCSARTQWRGRSTSSPRGRSLQQPGLQRRLGQLEFPGVRFDRQCGAVTRRSGRPGQLRLPRARRFYQDIDSSDAYDNRDRHSFRAQLLWTPNEAVEVRLIGDYTIKTNPAAQRRFGLPAPPARWWRPWAATSRRSRWTASKTLASTIRHTKT